MQNFSKVLSEVVFEVFVFVFAAVIASGSCSRSNIVGGLCGKSAIAEKAAAQP